jgi:VTC domain
MNNKNYQFKYVLDTFLPIGLDKMDRVKLMNRIDTKFLGSVSDLEYLLSKLLRDYYILEIKNERIQSYHTVYYDTADFQFYRMHHNGKLNRLKIRFREYESSQISFLEIKKKSNKKRTDKKRIQSNICNNGLKDFQEDFINNSTSVNANQLEEKLHNHFDRITLVGKERNERITIDLNLGFQTLKNNKRTLHNLVIIELKQDKDSGWSPIKQILKENRFRKHGFSKYCVGSMLCHPQLKYNRFKEHSRLIEKISNNKNYKNEQFNRNSEYNFAV